MFRVLIPTILISVVFVLAFAFGDGPPDASPKIDPGTPHPDVKGMTVSCPTSGWEWGTDDMVETMRELKALGVNWITIHPYASIRKSGAVRPYRMRRETIPDRYITRPIEEAHKLGLKIMIKPHLSYWGSFSWRGAIEFQTDEEWERFFAEYRKWIVDMARVSRNADAFVVGTELDRTIGREKEWRRIIREIRAEYSGPLTYAANWTDYQRVKFWDDLDVIGLQAYFPLLRAGEGEPTDERLQAGWAQIMTELRAWSEQTGKRIVFTELGYNRSSQAPFEPWAYQVGGDDQEVLKGRCLSAALRAIEAEPRVHGAFLWKWFPGNSTPRNFAQSTPAMRRIIEKFWRK